MPMQMNGVEAWITGEDKVHLDEFAPEFDQESDMVTCWISGEPGQVCKTFPDNAGYGSFGSASRRWGRASCSSISQFCLRLPPSSLDPIVHDLD